MARPSDLGGEIAEVSRAVRETNPERSHASVEEDRERARRVEAMTYRLAGLTFEQIGRRMGISESGAADLVRRSLSRAETMTAGQLRQLENQRLDALQSVIWTDALRGDQKAIATVLKIMNDRRKMNGLDEATKLEVSMNVRHEMQQALDNLEALVLEGEVVSETTTFTPSSPQQVDHDYQPPAELSRGADYPTSTPAPARVVRHSMLDEDDDDLPVWRPDSAPLVPDVNETAEMLAESGFEVPAEMTEGYEGD